MNFSTHLITTNLNCLVYSKDKNCIFLHRWQREQMHWPNCATIPVQQKRNCRTHWPALSTRQSWPHSCVKNWSWPKPRWVQKEMQLVWIVGQSHPAQGPEYLVDSVLGSLCCLMQHRGFDPPLGRIFLVEGIFVLELTWVLTPFPQNSFGWEYKPRSGFYTLAFHCMDSKDPDIHVLDGWMLATKTHPACTIREEGICDYSLALKNTWL